MRLLPLALWGRTFVPLFKFNVVHNGGAKMRLNGLVLNVFVTLSYLGILGEGHAADPSLVPPKAPAGFFQIMTPTFNVQCNISQAFTTKVATMVRNAEQRFYTLFSTKSPFSPDMVNGVSKQKFDKKGNIPGDAMTLWWKMRPYIEVKVYKNSEEFTNEWFDHIGVTDKQQRLRQGVPGAYFTRFEVKDNDYHGDKVIYPWLRSIRTYVANRSDDELERTLLHEMSHLFMQTYLLEFAGNPPKGQESQKRGTPAWLGEGVAQLFENLWSGAAFSKKELLRQQAMIYEAVELGDYYPFKEFINITNAHNLAAVAGDPLKATLNYAQSASVMDYMVHKAGAQFFIFLENLRAQNIEKNLRSKTKDRIPEIYSFQNECFKQAFSVDLTEVEKYWKDHVKTTMEKQLKSSPELYYWIGEYYLRRGKDKTNDILKAEEKFNLAMTLAPNKGEGYLGVGRLAIRKKNDKLALETLAKATELLPKDEEAWYFYGVAQTNMGQLKEACDSFSQSVKIYSHNTNALKGLGQAAFASRQYDRAMEAYELAYQIEHDAHLLFQEGHAAFFANKYRDAQANFARFAEAYPLDAQGALWYGLAAWRLGNVDFAIKKLEEAIKLNPKDPTAKEALLLANKGGTFRFQTETIGEAAGKVPVDSKTDPIAPDANSKETIRIEDE